MRGGGPSGAAPGGRRGAAGPGAGSKLSDQGFDVLVEQGAGAAAAFPDAAFADAGARLVAGVWGEAEAIVKVQKPSDAEAGALRDGDVLIGFLEPLTDAPGIERLASAG